MNDKKTEKALAQWGLSVEEIEQLGNRLEIFWTYYGQWTRTKTRDTSHYGYCYLSGLLRMKSERTYAGIARQMDISGQNLQHYMSHSPWSGQELMAQIRADISQRDEFQEESVLLLDESADAAYGQQKVGASRQYNGRLGKVDQCQVGVFLSLANQGYHTWVDGEIFLPKVWFTPEYAAYRQQVGIPKERYFQTKIELGWQMIARVQEEGLPFAAVACDELYGRDTAFRDQLDAAGLEYYADIPANTKIYLSEPVIGIPQNKLGRKAHKRRVLSPKGYRVDKLRRHPDTIWHRLTLRPKERGRLRTDFARCRVWTIREEDDEPVSAKEEWLLIRRDGKRHTYSLSNAAPDTPLLLMARRKAQRYFVERSIQDAKSELGWDEFQATKFLAWQHHLALTILASWFITETRLDWAEQYQRDPDLLETYEVEVLPALSLANVRELLRAAMPLPQLSPEDAAYLVVNHLVNRTRSRKSRLKNYLSHEI